MIKSRRDVDRNRILTIPRVSPKWSVLTVVCTPSRGQRNKSKKYLKPLSNKGHAFPTVSERQGYAGDV